jgi:hypothetical protein
MKINADNKMFLLVVTGIVLAALNIVVWMGANNGSIGAVENMPLWGAFVALNVVSILWAVSQLGLQPLVVAASYVGGGCLAFHGARGMAGVSVAELTTAGATYGAFGALAIGNVATKVRLAFFSRKQVPFVFIIITLLALDAVLNSRVSQAGWNVFLNALVLPFVVAGGVAGFSGWMISRVVHDKPAALDEAADAALENENAELLDAEADEAEAMMIKIPDSVDPLDEAGEAAPIDDTVLASVEVDSVEAEDETVALDLDDLEPGNLDDDFFPLEIDKNEEEFILPDTNSELIEIAAMVVDDPEDEARVHTEVVGQPDAMAAVEFKEPLPASDSVVEEDTLSNDAPAQEEQPEEHAVAVEETGLVNEQKESAAEVPAAAEESDEPKENGGEDWLSGHLDLLNKIK